MAVDLRYVGPFDEVRVPLPTGGEINVARGELGTFPDDLAKGMLDQPVNWEPVKKSEAKKKHDPPGHDTDPADTGDAN